MAARTAARWTTLVALLGTALAVPGAAQAAAPAAAPAAARAAALSPVDQRIHDKLVIRSTYPRLGPDLAGLVTDAGSGRILWSHNRGELQLPASNTKIVTAVTALRSFGGQHRFTTRTVKGRYWRHIVLVGAGDPSLTGRNLGTLAYRTATTVRAHGVRTATVYVDDSRFPKPSLAHGWKSSYVPTDVSPVRALVVNRHRKWDTSMDAGRMFAAKLAAHGVRVKTVTRGRAVSGATRLGYVKGQKLRYIVRFMLRESDNDHAEALHRLVARKAGYRATWAGARAAQRKVLAGMGVELGTSTLYDGSGLSRADRLTPAVVVRTLALIFDGKHPRLASLQHNSFAIAGRTGTLGADYLRYVTKPTKCAAGLIEAKTGSLSGVITLSGFARGADGRVKLFSFLLNRVPSTLETRRAADRLASTITGCW